LERHITYIEDDAIREKALADRYLHADKSYGR